MVSTDLDDFKKYFSDHRPDIERRYRELLRFPTVSSLPEALADLEACAAWIADHFRRCGCTVEEWRAGGAPVIYASLRSSDAKAPTVLIYNHYDVQPVDPLNEWTSPPFEMRVEGDRVYARGAQDNKGQLAYVLSALDMLCARKNLPCHLKFVVEGEEENGSASLTSIVADKHNELQADYVMIIDAGMRRPDVPAVNLGTRGLVNLTVTVTGTSHDLHSGIEGGIAYNPLHALVAMLAALRSPDGAIAIPGFYDAVVMPTAEEQARLALAFDEEAWERTYGQKPGGGERALSPLVRNWLRPTVEINGIHGGYGGPGSKTVIPKEAVAKLSCRLVPHQDPMTVGTMVREFLLSSVPVGVTADVVIHPGMGRATRTSPDAPGIKALARAMEMVWDVQPEYILDGASIPIIPMLQASSGGEVITWGVGLPTDRIHAPNERFDFGRMEKGLCTLLLTLGLLGNEKRDA